MTQESVSLASSCWRKERDGNRQPRQLRQHEPPTCESIGSQAITHNSTQTGSLRDWISVAPTGAMSSSDHGHPRQHRRHLPMPPESCQCAHRCTTTCPQSDSDDDVDVEFAELLAIRARRRIAKARYRANHPERVAEQRRRYREKHPDKIAAQRRRYREKYRAKRLEDLRGDYTRHAEKRGPIKENATAPKRDERGGRSS